MTDTVAAISTSLDTASAIGIIRISGAAAVRVAAAVFRPYHSEKSIENMRGYTACYGHAFDGGGDIDDGVLTCFRAPHSYTGEDVVEISLHGGREVLLRTLRAVYDNGAAPAKAGEFTKRAYLNGKLSLTQAEAVMEVITAKSPAALTAANLTKNGAVFNEISELKDKLVYCAASLAASIDYPDEGEEDIDYTACADELEVVRGRLDGLLARYDYGAVMRDGIDCVIVGRPNVGKSTLMNLLAGCERSIVTETAGTTRDIVSETVNIGGVLLRLSDTAGIRAARTAAERLGVERARASLGSAQLVLAVFSADTRLNDDELEILDMLSEIPSVLVVNKTDLAEYADIERLRRTSRVVCVCARKKQGIDELQTAIFEACGISELSQNEACLSNERQRDAAKRALTAVTTAIEGYKNQANADLLSVIIEDAIGALTELTGENVGESVVNEVFAKFCVGK